MDVSFSLWHLGLSLLIATIAFGFSVKAASRYSHVGLTLLCASLGIETLASLLSLFMIVLDPGKVLLSFLGLQHSALPWPGLADGRLDLTGKCARFDR